MDTKTAIHATLLYETHYCTGLLHWTTALTLLHSTAALNCCTMTPHYNTLGCCNTLPHSNALLRCTTLLHYTVRD